MVLLQSRVVVALALVAKPSRKVHIISSVSPGRGAGKQPGYSALVCG